MFDKVYASKRKFVNILLNAPKIQFVDIELNALNVEFISSYQNKADALNRVSHDTSFDLIALYSKTYQKTNCPVKRTCKKLS